ncbi:glutathione S-transferase family protein [Polaromonas jejuensis]|uniref:Glutathione S-transferase family protein n=1 Tax=Polaromonas jejuensis TaxID=457502 RepID=A0ABW0Q739_9BURK|nr:glutathione S-transferase family protein [Polaromonas jejuensis]
MIQLHYYPSTAAMAPHVLLQEIGVPFQLVLVDRSQDVHKTQQYLQLNPNGLIPALTDGDLVLYESAAICLHLCDSYPEAALAPALGTPERAHFYKWLMWLTNTLQATLIIYFYPERWMNASNPAGAAELKTHAEGRVRVLLDQLDRELARHGGPWLLGDAYTALDAYAMMLCRWTRNFGQPARTRPQLGPYLQRVLARPAVIRTFAAEGLAQPWV